MINNRFSLRDINPLRGLNEPRLVSLLDEGEGGSYATLQWLYRFVEKRNPTARAVKRRLLSALGRLEWNIKTADCGDDPQKQALAEKQAATLRAAYDRVKNLRAALNFLALADLRGFSHVEKIYAGEGAEDPWAIAELRLVEQWFWVRDGLYGAWQYNRDARQGLMQGEPVSLEKFIVREVDDPADEIIARFHVRQEANDADWDGYLEDFGNPTVFIEGPPNVSPEKEREYQAQAERITAANRGYIPNGASAHVVAAATGSSVFKERLEYLEGQIVVAGTSGKLTILTESGSGTLAGGAQADAFDDVAQALALLINETMQAGFDREVLERAHRGEPVLAYFEFAAVDEEDGSKALADAKLAKEAGFDMDAEEMSERSGYKLTATTAPPPTDLTADSENKPSAEVSQTAAGSAVKVGEETAKALKVTPEFVAPAQSVFDELLTKAADGSVSNEELLASAHELLRKLPALATQSDVTAVADALQGAMQQAVEKTLGA